MAKKARSGESVARYFRTIFEENPGLLKGKSNQKLLDRWLTDHPDQTEVPKKVKASLSNIKSVLRSKGRRKGKTKEASAGKETHGMIAVASARPKKTHALEMLEEQIDDCLRSARNLENESLASVITLLRRARNEVVWMIGE